jgi:hypothetical protein
VAAGAKPGIDVDSIQNTVDGTLCRAKSPAPGTLHGYQTLSSSIGIATNPVLLVYCELWSQADRKAFWTGFLGRVEDFGEEYQLYFLWFRSAFGLGGRDGDFAKAWSSFGSAVGQLAELGFKLTVVLGIPRVMQMHPKRDAYARELADLGVNISRALVGDYQKAYENGGIPRCTGLLLADILRLVFEILGAKGLAKTVSAAKFGELLQRLPTPFRSIPTKIRNPSRMDLVLAIQHDKKAALYGRGILTDLRPGQYVVRVEAEAARYPGNWFNGPFNTTEEARRYADYLADLGEGGIRRESALPLVWEDGNGGNKVEIIRIYEVRQPTPAISSVVAPQMEGKAATHGGKAVVRAGQGQQLSMPVVQAAKVHDMELVRRLPGQDIKVKKP